MFLTMLNDDERRAFALLAEKMIQADGIVVGREESALASLLAEMGVTDADRQESSIEDLAAAFSSRRSKVVAALELIGLGYSDTSFSVSERSLVTELAQHMGLSKDDLEGLESWVKKHVELIRSALALMRE
jgi:uncharacterized tellurite resistance protein B-like protein